MKFSPKWLILVAIIILIASGIQRALTNRKVKEQALQAQTEALQSQTIMSILSTDVEVLEPVSLSKLLPIGGQIQAIHSAYVKALTPGVIRGLKIREGDLVKSNQLLANVEDTDATSKLRQAQEQLAAAQAQLRTAELSNQNNKDLFEKGFISKTALLNSQSLLDVAIANRNTARATLVLNEKGLQNTDIRAPNSGQIAQTLVQDGERVSLNARMLKIVELRQLELEVNFSPIDVSKTRVGQQALLKVEGSSLPIKAELKRLNPITTSGTRNIMGYFSLESTTGLRQGLFVQGSLLLGSKVGISAPLSSVRFDKPEPYIQVINDSRIQHVTVKLGEQGEFKGRTMVEIDDINSGTKILNGRLGFIQDGTPVKVQIVKP